MRKRKVFYGRFYSRFVSSMVKHGVFGRAERLVRGLLIRNKGAGLRHFEASFRKLVPPVRLVSRRKAAAVYRLPSPITYQAAVGDLFSWARAEIGRRQKLGGLSLAKRFGMEWDRLRTSPLKNRLRVRFNSVVHTMKYNIGLLYLLKRRRRRRMFLKGGRFHRSPSVIFWKRFKRVLLPGYCLGCFESCIGEGIVTDSVTIPLLYGYKSSPTAGALNRQREVKGIGRGWRRRIYLDKLRERVAGQNKHLRDRGGRLRKHGGAGRKKGLVSDFDGRGDTESIDDLLDRGVPGIPDFPDYYNDNTNLLGNVRRLYEDPLTGSNFRMSRFHRLAVKERLYRVLSRDKTERKVRAAVESLKFRQRGWV